MKHCYNSDRVSKSWGFVDPSDIHRGFGGGGRGGGWWGGGGVGGGSGRGGGGGGGGEARNSISPTPFSPNSGSIVLQTRAALNNVDER